MVKKRIEWIDAAKGLGMILVMLAHSPIPVNLRKAIYTFHMPLFFFLSGYLLNSSKHPNFIGFIKSKFKSLLIPYFSFSLINYVYWILISRNLLKVGTNVNVLKPLFGMFYAVRNTPWTLHIGTLWFVACLFVSELLLYLVIKISKNNQSNIMLVLVLSSLAGYLYSRYIRQPLPWSIDASVHALVFLGIGYLLAQNKDFEKELFRPRNVVILIMLNVIPGAINPHIDMFSNYYGDNFLFYISALAGIISLIILVQYIQDSKVLKYIGKNTFIYLSFHNFIIFPLIGKMLTYFNLVTTKTWLGQLLTGLIYTLIALLTLIPVVAIINNYFPFILGKSKQSKNRGLIRLHS